MSREEGAGDGQPAHKGDASSQQLQRLPGPPGPSAEEKPIKAGEVLDVAITETSRRGDGNARIRGSVIFAPTATHGQHILIRVTSIKQNYAVAELGQPPTVD